MHKAVDEIGTKEGFKGYGPEQGYDFLRDAIVKNDYKSRGIDVKKDEIFVSDGAKCDCGNIVDIFGKENKSSYYRPCLSCIFRYKHYVRKRCYILTCNC